MPSNEVIGEPAGPIAPTASRMLPLLGIVPIVAAAVRFGRPHYLDTEFASAGLMLLCAGAPTEADRSLLARATARGMLVLALTGVVTGVDADFHFAVPSDNPLIVQESHEKLYQVLWELVHVLFEHLSAE